MPVDHEKDVIALTCASGKQCSRLIPLLYGKWKNIRLAVHTPSSEASLKKQYPDAEIVCLDLTRSEDIQQFLTGVTTVLHIGPPFHPHEVGMGFLMIDAARREAQTGVLKHFIYSSVLHPQLRKLMNHDCKRYVEEYLIESGLNYTIVQPSHLLDTFPVEQLLQQEEPVFHANYNPNVTFSFTILQDLADAFLTVIEEREKHYLAEYMICSTGPTSYADVVAALSKVIGKPIQITTREYNDAVLSLQSLISADPTKTHRLTRDGIQRMQLYYNFYGIKGNTNVLEWLIDRKPTTVEDFFREKVQSSEGKQK